MATMKKITPPATVTAAMPALLPKAPVNAKAAGLLPAKLPVRKSASAKKPAVIKELVVKESVQVEKAATPEKIKKPKLVRDSFTIPKVEYAVLDELKQRATLLTRPVKKSELLRAGIKLLATLPDAQFLAALAEVPAIKTGRSMLEK